MLFITMHIWKKQHLILTEQTQLEPKLGFRGMFPLLNLSDCDQSCPCPPWRRIPWRENARWELSLTTFKTSLTEWWREVGGNDQRFRIQSSYFIKKLTFFCYCSHISHFSINQPGLLGEMLRWDTGFLGSVIYYTHIHFRIPGNTVQF